MESNIDRKERTVYVTGMHKNVNEEMIYDLFEKVGLVEKVVMHEDDNGDPHHALVVFRNPEAVMYSISVYNGTSLFDTPLNMRPLRESSHAAVFQRGSFAKNYGIRSTETTPQSSPAALLSPSSLGYTPSNATPPVSPSNTDHDTASPSPRLLFKSSPTATGEAAGGRMEKSGHKGVVGDRRKDRGDTRTPFGRPAQAFSRLGTEFPSLSFPGLGPFRYLPPPPAPFATPLDHGYYSSASTLGSSFGTPPGTAWGQPSSYPGYGPVSPAQGWSDGSGAYGYNPYGSRGYGAGTPDRRGLKHHCY